MVTQMMPHQWTVLRLSYEVANERYEGYQATFREVVLAAQAYHLSEDQVLESLRLLEELRYIDSVADVERHGRALMTPLGFHVYATNFLDGFAAIKDAVAAEVAGGERVRSAIAKKLQQPAWLVGGILDLLQAEGVAL